MHINVLYVCYMFIAFLSSKPQHAELIVSYAYNVYKFWNIWLQCQDEKPTLEVNPQGLQVTLF